MTDLTLHDWLALDLGTSVPGGFQLVARLSCLCGKHDQPPVIAIVKKGGAYRMLRQRRQGGWDSPHAVHALHAKYSEAHWKMEATGKWNDLSGHTLTVEMMPRPRGVRYR